MPFGFSWAKIIIIRENTLYGLVVQFDDHIDMSRICFTKFDKKKLYLLPEQNSHTSAPRYPKLARINADVPFGGLMTIYNSKLKYNKVKVRTTLVPSNIPV